MVEANEKLTKLQPRDLAGYEGILYVKNLTPTMIIHDERGNNHSLHLGPAGSDSDAGILDISVARAPGFQKLWRRGKVEVITDAVFEDYINKQDDKAEAAEKKRMDEVLGALEEAPAKRDLVQTKDKFGEIAFETEGAREEREKASAEEAQEGAAKPVVTSRVADAEGNETEVETKVVIMPTMKG